MQCYWHDNTHIEGCSRAVDFVLIVVVVHKQPGVVALRYHDERDLRLVVRLQWRAGLRYV
jgi:hypothetical protein